MRIIYTVYKTEAEAKKAMHKMVKNREIDEMEFPYIAERPEAQWRKTNCPWAIWISP